MTAARLHSALCGFTCLLPPGSSGPAARLAAGLGAALHTAAAFDAPYWMEAPLRQRVCPALGCGPSGGGLHAVDEWLDLQQLRAYAEALPLVLTAWAATADRDHAAG